MKIKRNILTIGIAGLILLCVLLAGFYAFRLHIIPALKKAGLTAWLQTPTKLTIYEKNNNDFPKTKIPLPEDQNYLIAVYKDQHKLKLLENNQVLKEYDVNIRREKQDRAIWEDNQTPEGIFFIETMDTVIDPPWSHWMRLNTLEKARSSYIEAYDDGVQRIADFEQKYGELNSDDQLRAFNEQNADQKIVRGIGIHGGGFSIYHDWTEGCIALSDEDVIEMYDILKQSENGGIGTNVVIMD